jgi:hypothetical protein
VDTTVAAFLAAHYFRRPDARVSMRDAFVSFLASLPDDRTRRLWPRWRFVAEVSREFPTGTDGCGRLMIGGLGDSPPERWAVDDVGRLRLTRA